MNPFDLLKGDQIQRLLGARDERICQLERQIISLRERLESDAQKWQRLLLHREELAAWLVECATNESGHVLQPRINSGLKGEQFVPCSFTTTNHGRRYQLSLVNMDYEVSEVAGNG